MQLTPLFPPEIKPVHHGVYAVCLYDGNEPSLHGYARFDGVWGCIYPTVEDAYQQPMDAFFASQRKHWQGLL